ncbi:hypothetical protein GCM10023215_56260 [Pseudonocardia yuanmonensis]|uniref:Cupin type-2 domain-containing protein n=1 Tax=Pseudonocardia yuanmonensis TaxID=1095914 RepID=A0ABP8XI10_9PSEU
MRFAPGVRSAWHSHARGQYRHVTSGVADFGGRDGTVHEVHAGQTLDTPPGEEHWHAAAPDCLMEHVALRESADDPADSVTWLEHITDEEHARRASGVAVRHLSCSRCEIVVAACLTAWTACGTSTSRRSFSAGTARGVRRGEGRRAGRVQGS